MGNLAERQLMSSGFYREGDARIVLRLEEVERMLLISMAEQILEIVTPHHANPDADPLFAIVGIEPTSQRPTSEVVLRLFPDAYGDDDEAASEFSRFTELDLRQMKTAHAQAALEALQRSGEKVMLTNAMAPSWMGFLNDVRLALGVRIGIDDDFHDEVDNFDRDDPRLPLLGVYDWLTYLQESLVQIMLP